MDVLIVFGFPFLIVALGIGYGAFQRYLKHKERMAMIEKGLVPPDFEDDGDDEGSKRNDRYSPIVVTLVGVALDPGSLDHGDRAVAHRRPGADGHRLRHADQPDSQRVSREEGR